MHPLLTIPVNIVIDKYGVRISLIIGSILCIIGSWTRLFVGQSFYMLIVGSIICGIGSPFILNVQGKIIANWFFPKDHSFITSFLCFFMIIFSFIGMLFPSFVFNNYNEHHAQHDPSLGRNLMVKLILIEALIATLFLLPNLFFLREKPIHPPSYTFFV